MDSMKNVVRDGSQWVGCGIFHLSPQMDDRWAEQKKIKLSIGGCIVTLNWCASVTGIICSEDGAPISPLPRSRKKEYSLLTSAAKISSPLPSGEEGCPVDKEHERRGDIRLRLKDKVIVFHSCGFPRAQNNVHTLNEVHR